MLYHSQYKKDIYNNIYVSKIKPVVVIVITTWHLRKIENPIQTTSDEMKEQIK